MSKQSANMVETLITLHVNPDCFPVKRKRNAFLISIGSHWQRFNKNKGKQESYMMMGNIQLGCSIFRYEIIFLVMQDIQEKT